MTLDFSNVEQPLFNLRLKPQIERLNLKRD